MPLHHYLPASFIARFSTDPRKISTREKRVIVGDKRLQKCFQSSAEKVGCVNNLYTLTYDTAFPEAVDQTWAEYENKLPAALDSLIAGNVNAEVWLRVLVPFVACMLVRGPDFQERFTGRFPQELVEKLEGIFDADHANRARLRELQLLLTDVLVSKWMVLRAHGKEKIIINDIGYAPFMHPPTGDQGIAIPINQKTILAIIPKRENRTLLYEKDNQWVPDIQYADLPSKNQEGLNQTLARYALRFIFGPDFPTVQKHLRGAPEAYTAPEPDELGFHTDKSSRAYEFTWYRLVSAIKKPPSDAEGWDFSLDWDVITSGWCPVPFTPLNLIEFPSILERIDDTIAIRLYDPQIYFDISEIVFLEDAKEFDAAIEAATRSLSRDLEPFQRLSILAKRADLYLRNGNVTKALADRDELMAMAPTEKIGAEMLRRQGLQFPIGARLKIFLRAIIRLITSLEK